MSPSAGLCLGVPANHQPLEFLRWDDHDDVHAGALNEHWLGIRPVDRRSEKRSSPLASTWFSCANSLAIN